MEGGVKKNCRRKGGKKIGRGWRKDSKVGWKKD